MELINATKLVAGYTLGMEPSGREHLVVVIKGTFDIPANSPKLKLADEQVPLITADEYMGDPGFSAVKYESDYSLFKPNCDVVLNGNAYAPQGKPAERVIVGLRVGELTKSFYVVGDRQWAPGLIGITHTRPDPFLTMPISYENAYGGVDEHPSDPNKVKAYMANPIGVGYHPFRPKSDLYLTHLPNTETLLESITSPTGEYQPMSFGILGRNFAQRVVYAGTYDQDWLDNVFPFLPKDFDNRYFQCAPADQQMEYPAGGEEVVLSNLDPTGRMEFELPKMDVPVEFCRSPQDRTPIQAHIDTIIIEPGLRRLMMVWRASFAIEKSLFELQQVVIGKMPRGWYRARELGKTYYPSLAHLVEAK